MTNKAKQIVLFPIATFAIAGLMLSCTSLNELGARPEAEAGKAAAFQLSGLSINPPEVAARDEVVITAEVTNVTSVDDTYKSELKINNVTESSDKVLVPAGKTQTLTFVIFKDAPGTYKVSLGQLVSQFVVAESIAAGPVNQLPAIPGQTVAGCCAVGNQTTSPALGQTGAGCCGTGIQNSPATQPRPTGGCGCCGR
ncbi:MAG: hypothetical protein ABSB38_03945 [Dehalococcoidia bacterium]|jgi:hypothetical protein